MVRNTRKIRGEPEKAGRCGTGLTRTGRDGRGRRPGRPGRPGLCRARGIRPPPPDMLCVASRRDSRLKVAGDKGEGGGKVKDPSEENSLEAAAVTSQTSSLARNKK